MRIMTDPIASFLNRCDAYRLQRTPPISRARLATLLFNDGAKLDSLDAGTDIGTRRLARAVADLSALEAALIAPEQEAA